MAYSFDVVSPVKRMVKNVLRVQFKRDYDEEPIWGTRRSMRDILYNPLYMMAYMLAVPLFGVGVILLIVKYFERRSTVYVLTNKRLFLSKGVFSQTHDEIEISRIRDTRSHQTVFERLIGVGSIYVSSYDRTGNIVMKSIEDPHYKRDQIREAANDLRDNY